MRALPKKEKPQTLKKERTEMDRNLDATGLHAHTVGLLEYQQALGLDALDMNILLHLAKHWWYKDNPPFPSKGSIAEHMGVDDSTVRRRIAKMEKKGFIKRKCGSMICEARTRTSIYWMA